MVLEKIIHLYKSVEVLTAQLKFALIPYGKDYCCEKYKSNDNICMLNFSHAYSGVDCKFNQLNPQYPNLSKCTYDKKRWWE